ncbi:MAG TPA: hypothetical protein VIV06_06635 [Candidatus Limnocylindrales bacterium]
MTKLHDSAVPGSHITDAPETSAASRCSVREARAGGGPMEGIVGIVVVVLIVLFVLGYFGRGRFRA